MPTTTPLNGRLIGCSAMPCSIGQLPTSECRQPLTQATLSPSVTPPISTTQVMPCFSEGRQLTPFNTTGRSAQGYQDTVHQALVPFETAQSAIAELTLLRWRSTTQGFSPGVPSLRPAGPSVPADNYQDQRTALLVNRTGARVLPSVATSNGLTRC